MVGEEWAHRAAPPREQGASVRAGRGGETLRSIRLMAAKELREAFQSGRVALAGIVMGVLLVMSMFLMYRDFQERLENYDLIRPEPTESVAVVRPNPLSVLARGYAICRLMPSLEVVREAGEVEPGDAVAVKLHRGDLLCRVEERRPGEDRESEVEADR